MHATITLATPIERTPRVVQVEGYFDVPPARMRTRTWDVRLPLEEFDWNVGLIVGPSGSGKSTVANQLFPEAVRDQHSYTWSATQAVVDAFPASTCTTEVVALLSSVGFSSPPGWLRPFHRLSTGEKFRVAVARMLAEDVPLMVCDEFTSTVDRTVAQIASAAIARTIRKTNKRFIAVTCHEDVIDWLQPDWTYRPGANQFARRSLQPRPIVELRIHRVTRAAWALFRHHHYLDAGLHPSAQCFLATWRDRPVAFSAWIGLVGRTQGGAIRREHRTVCLPDYQGIGLGNAVSDFCAALQRGAGYRATSTTSHPAMIAARRRSPHWRLLRAPDLGPKSASPKACVRHSVTRLTASFEYVGPAAPSAAVAALVHRSTTR